MRTPTTTFFRTLAALFTLGVGAALAAPVLTVNAAAGVTALDLDGEGSAAVHIVKVADLTIDTTNVYGFTLYVTSGSLTKTGGATSIPFRVTTVPAGSGAPASSAFDNVPSGETYPLVTTVAGPGDCGLYIRYTPADLQDPGAYGATIDISVTDNPS